MIVDELRVHATRCLAAIRITVRKAPEVLVVLLHDVILSEWLLVRMCFVLCHVKDDPLRNELIASMACLLRVWKEANPGAWSDLRKCNRILRSFIYSKPILPLPRLMSSDHILYQQGRIDDSCFERRIQHSYIGKRRI